MVLVSFLECVYSGNSYPPILLPTKSHWNAVSRLCGRRDRRETRKKTSTENQSCLGWKSKGTKGVGRVDACWLSLVPPAGTSPDTMDLISRGVVFKALVFLCFIRSSQGIFHLFWFLYSSYRLATNESSPFEVRITSLSSCFSNGSLVTKGSPSAMLEFDNWHLFYSFCLYAWQLFCFWRFNLAFWLHSGVRSLG